MTLKEQWQYGKWRTGGSILAITFGQIQTFFTAGILGLDAAGTLRALQNFIQPMVQVETAIESLGLPSLAREYSQGNIQAVKKKALFISFSLFILALIYMLFLMHFANLLDTFIYSGRYNEQIHLVNWLALTPVFLALAMGFTMPLLAGERPQYYAVVYAVNAPISLIATPLLLHIYGIGGATASLVIPSVINVLVSFVLYRMWFSIPEVS
jgi:O-antigen/teichoic acid export membrane protein